MAFTTLCTPFIPQMRELQLWCTQESTGTAQELCLQFKHYKYSGMADKMCGLNDGPGKSHVPR